MAGYSGAAKAAMRAMASEMARDTKSWQQIHNEKRALFDDKGFHYSHENDPERDFLSEANKRMRERAIQAKLEVLLIDYTFMNDDGKISFGEKSALTKHFKTYKNKLKQKDIINIGNIRNTTLYVISSYITEFNISKVDINKALYALRKICKEKERYNQIIKQLESRFINDEEFY